MKFIGRCVLIKHLIEISHIYDTSGTEYYDRRRRRLQRTRRPIAIEHIYTYYLVTFETLHRFQVCNVCSPKAKKKKKEKKKLICVFNRNSYHWQMRNWLRLLGQQLDRPIIQNSSFYLFRKFKKIWLNWILNELLKCTARRILRELSVLRTKRFCLSDKTVFAMTIRVEWCRWCVARPHSVVRGTATWPMRKNRTKNVHTSHILPSTILRVDWN